ncbi:MAG: 1,4-alpha-glucan branching protein domain-containing protein [Ignavibacteriota bacterium]
MLGYFTFVLHTHLPYVLHHGKWPFGSDWLSEAVSECYLPILSSLEELQARGVKAKISMDFSPILLEQLADPKFAKIFSDYCDEKIALAISDQKLFSENNEHHFLPLAAYWEKFYTDCKRRFHDDYDGDLISAFRKLSDAGVLDAMTCGATHGYFPLLLDDRNIRAQIQLAIATHEKYFGKKPRGIWLPECAYRPRYWWSPQSLNGTFEEFHKERAGIEELLSEYGLEYFVVEGSLTKGGTALPSYHNLMVAHHQNNVDSLDWQKYLLFTEEKKDRSLADIYGVRSTMRDLKGKTPIVFSRDRKTSEQVWSGDVGYPGNPAYLDFHKKHHNSGLRYWKVTGHKVDIGAKEPYDPSATNARIEIQAQHFVGLVKQTLIEHLIQTGKPGVVCSPFDTELFGHWWFEGPHFLAKVLELLSSDQDVSLSDCAEIIDNSSPRETIALPEGSWGEGGGHYVWLNRKVAWTWEEIYSLEKRFLATIEKLGRSPVAVKMGAFQTKILEQAARELLLLEASDWQFLITTEGAADYAAKRFTEHCNRLKALLDISDRLKPTSKGSKKDTAYLLSVSEDDKPFAKIDLDWWKMV